MAGKMKVVTFGELMLRLTPQGYLRFTQADDFCATYGGGEANVAVSLAGFGADACFVTKLPKHDIGQCALNYIRKFGVDTSQIKRGGSRIGIYFLEKGASQRPSKIVYDRAGSSLADACADDFDWDRIFKDADWFHFTGITPALGNDLSEICMQALKAARSRGIMTSCDLNYRKNLWGKEKAKTVMTPLMEYVDVCIANEEDAGSVFGIESPKSSVEKGIIDNSGYIEVAEELYKRFGFKKVAVTLRKSVSANDNLWSAMLFSNGECFFSKEYKIHIVDRVGGGDSFAAGLIFASLSGYTDQLSVEFAVAASCLKHSIEGDLNLVSLDEVNELVRGNASGRVQR